MTRFTVFGLGEAGSEIAAGLVAAGIDVAGYDPAPVAAPEGVARFDDPVLAVEATELVLGVTSAADAMTALTQALDAIPAGAHYADLATSSASAKVALAEVAADRALAFVDVALMGTAPGNGLAIPALASGQGAPWFAQTMVPLGMPVEAVGGEPGEAATRKLLRSVVVKGIAGLVIESMRAADAAGFARETWANLVHQFTEADEAFLRRIVEGTGPHARRRLHEMEATAEMLTDLGVDPVMTRGTVESLRRVVDDGIGELPA